MSASVDGDATSNTDNTGGNVLLDDLVVSIGGSTGREVFNFEAGASVNQIVAAVNLVSDATGVAASQDSWELTLNSTEYGSDAFVDVDVLDEGVAGTFESGLTRSTHAKGSDIQATVNGVNADGDGNVLSDQYGHLGSVLDRSRMVTTRTSRSTSPAVVPCSSWARTWSATSRLASASRA